MYVEFNDSEQVGRDWEISIEFYPAEKAEYEFYITTSSGEESLRPEGAVEEVQKARGKAKRTRKHVHKRVLQYASNKAARLQRNFW